MTAVLEQSNRVSITLLDNDLRLIDSKRYTVTYQMFSMATEQDFGHESFNQNKSFLKINLFLSTIVDNSVAYRIEDTARVEKMLAEYDNNLMVLPDLDDITLLECLHRKMQAIAGEYTVVSKISLLDHETGLTYHGFYEDDEGYHLPSQEDFAGDMSYWKTPWWDRYDVLTFDNFADSQQEIDDHRSNVELERLTDLFDDIDDNIDEILNNAKAGLIVDDMEESKKPGKVVSLDQAKKDKKRKGKFKPKLV
jgi:hypothetical protein